MTPKHSKVSSAPRFSLALLSCLLCLIPTSYAEKIHIAAASNFSTTMKVLIQDFEETSDHQIKASFASSGKIYAQIKHGAPYSVFFSADKAKPLKLIQEGFVNNSKHFTYAIGALALWSAKPNFIKDHEILRTGSFNKLALANPKLAPYGLAAAEALTNLGLTQLTQKKWVQGENIAQTYQFVSTGNADLGFVALSQVLSRNHANSDLRKQGSYWIVANDLYNPIQQDAVLLKRSEHSASAIEFWNYMHSDKAKALIQSHGYSLPQ